MPKFSEEIVDKFIDAFFESLPENDRYQERVVGAVYYALIDDSFREEIANPMEDVKRLIVQAEEYIQLQMDLASL